ncbi:type II secretion system F family protein [Diaminobutyricibacter sp. McL0618]|uniref:type II secretion system F family protein n=1 Tax=Leifsonia sp. McL0618 TaxID=3415677 RepID=UPI003CF16458
MRSDRAARSLAIDGLAILADTVATLLEAGIVPEVAWAYLAEAGNDPLAVAVGRAVARGESVVAAIVHGGDAPSRRVKEARAVLAAAWWVASESGAPLAACLRACADSFRGQGDTERDIAVALAGPVLTARMVSILPLVGLLFGAVLGFDTVGALTGSPVGWGLLIGGVLLMGLGAAWNRMLVRRATQTNGDRAIELELLSVALSGGAAIAVARELVAEATRRFLPGGAEAGSTVDHVLQLSARAGIPAGGLLRSEADRRRRESRSAGQTAASTLAVRLMLPLGLCVLPSFMFLGVAPLVLVIVSSTFATL